MGRKNGKLIPFLKESLAKRTFVNLKWEVDEEIFCVEFPRYDKKKSLGDFERILRAWYDINGKPSKYSNYSKGRGVLLAALNKSDYLVHEPYNNKKFCYRFGTEDEIKEKKKMKKIKVNLTIDDASLEDPNLSPMSTESDSPSPLPLLSPDQGYQSMEEENNESFKVVEECSIPDDPDLSLVLSVYLNSPEDIANAFLDMNLENEDPLEDIKTEELVQPFIGIQPTAETSSTSTVSETQWLYATKLKVDSTLVLICEKLTSQQNVFQGPATLLQVTEDKNQGIVAGQIVIPNNVWEPGEYTLERMFESDGKYFLYCKPTIMSPNADSA